MKTLVRNSIFMASFNIFGRASGAVRTLLLMFFLTQNQYSLVSYSLYMGTLCRHFSDGGLDNFISRDGARDYTKIPSFYVNALFLKSLFAFTFCTGAYFYLSSARGLDGYAIMIVYIAMAGSVMTSITGVFRSCFSAIERMEFILYTNLPSRITSISLLFLALWFAFPLEIAVATISLENIIWFFLLGGLSLRMFQLSGVSISFRVLRYMLWESMPLMVYGFFNVLYLSLDVIMIENILGLNQVAPYTYSSLLLEGVILLLSSYYVAVYPTLSRLYQTDFEAYRRLFRQSVTALFLFTIPVSVMICFWSDLWMNVVIWTGSTPPKVLSVLAVNLNLSMMNTLLILVFTSCNRQRLLVLFTSFAVTISFCSNWVMIPLFEQPGAAWASLFSQVCMFCIMSVTASRLFSLTYPWKRPLQLMLLSVFSAVAAIWIPYVHLIFEPLIYAIILMCAGYVSGIITKEEWQKARDALRPKKPKELVS